MLPLKPHDLAAAAEGPVLGVACRYADSDHDARMAMLQSSIKALVAELGQVHAPCTACGRALDFALIYLEPFNSQSRAFEWDRDPEESCPVHIEHGFFSSHSKNRVLYTSSTVPSRLIRPRSGIYFSLERIAMQEARSFV